MNFNGRKEMLYLTTHSTHFISSYMASEIIWEIYLVFFGNGGKFVLMYLFTNVLTTTTTIIIITATTPIIL